MKSFEVIIDGKKVKVTRKSMINNIKKMYDMADKDQGCDWYFVANLWARSLSNRYKIDFQKVCAIVSACSINVGWSQNINLVNQYMDTGRIKGLPIVQKKCDQIMQGEIESALKTDKLWNFYQNIFDFENPIPVTIDRHATAIAYVGKAAKKFPKPTPKRYAQIADCYRIVAKELGLIPCTLQAVVWIQYRKLRSIEHYG